eukprot:166166-Hanusia_phi.AAC.2
MNFTWLKCQVVIDAVTGNTQDRYVLGGPGGDNFAGRLLSGLDNTTSSFSALPPHFTDEGLRQVREIGWERFIPQYEQLPAGFRKCLPFFLASILYHLPTLREWFRPEHPIWGMHLFEMFGSSTMTTLNELRKEIIMVNGRCTHCSMTASGIPNKTEVISRVDNLTQEFEKFKVEIVRLIEPLSRSVHEQHGGGSIADGVYLEDLRRQVQNVQHTVGQLQEVVNGISRKIDRMDDRMDENSTQVMNTLTQIRTKLTEMGENTRMRASTASGQREDGMTESLETSLVTRDREVAADRDVDQVRMEEEGSGGEGESEEDFNSGEARMRREEPDEDVHRVQGDADQPEYFEWDGDGQRHMIPMDYIFPLNITVSAMYRRWHVGQSWEEQGTRRKVWIRPLRFLQRLPFSMDVTDENTRKNIGKADL